IVVENRPGAGGTLAATHVARAAPDGYTFLIHHNGMSTAPALYRKLPFNSLTDFTYVGQVADVPMTLLGRKDLPPGDMVEFIKYTRANGNKINLANAGLGAVSQLCGMLLQEALGTQFTTIPYAGTAPALTALLGGQVDVLCDQTTNTTQQIDSGKVKAYAVTSLQRVPTLPKLPTM
ncbi:tripartite tricarboxylate transporter substrate-binding protein, partial [Piscirickettsia salmonis]|uniref:tripartite tricarboxylate transporter substrate-binding protein n=1 Tax=Piscirickettsia salmonis TaxID=1238 RepID=UPI00211D42E8